MLTGAGDSHHAQHLEQVANVYRAIVIQILGTTRAASKGSEQGEQV